MFHAEAGKAYYVLPFLATGLTVAAFLGSHLNQFVVSIFTLRMILESEDMSHEAEMIPCFQTMIIRGIFGRKDLTHRALVILVSFALFVITIWTVLALDT